MSTSTTAVGTRTTAVSEGFESESENERMKEKGSELGLLVKSKMVSFGHYWFFFFFNSESCTDRNLRTGRNLPERPERTETSRNQTGGGTGGVSSTGLHTGTKNFGCSGRNGTVLITMILSRPLWLLLLGRE